MFGFLKRKMAEAERPTEQSSSQQPEGMPAFRMTVEDVFTIPGDSTVAMGTVECGAVHVKDEIFIMGKHGRLTARVDGLEKSCRTVKIAQAGEHVGVCLHKIAHTQVEQGDVLLRD